jgi:hypothetical protein
LVQCTLTGYKQLLVMTRLLPKTSAGRVQGSEHRPGLEGLEAQIPEDEQLCASLLGAPCLPVRHSMPLHIVNIPDTQILYLIHRSCTSCKQQAGVSPCTCQNCSKVRWHQKLGSRTSTFNLEIVAAAAHQIPAVLAQQHLLIPFF